MSVKTITGSAMLLGIALLSQGFLRLIIPIHGLVQFLVGTMVGTCISLATWRYGLWSGIAIAVITPVMAYMQGALTFIVFVPIIAFGNCCYAFIVKGLGLQKVWLTALWAAATKSVVLLAILWGTFQIVTGIPTVMQDGIMFSMGIPQLITGSCGVLLGGFIYKRIGLAKRGYKEL